MAEYTHPLTKFYFAVDIGNDYQDAAFTEVSAPEATVEAIQYREGTSVDFVQYKVAGLVSHGNVTLKYALRTTVEFRKWILECVDDNTRSKDMRRDVTITLMDPNNDQAKKEWTLRNAWACKYTAPDLNATANELAFESVELAYDTLEIGE